MNRTVIYARVSTTGQAEEGTSLDTQVRACEKFSKEQKLNIVRTVKEAFSGAYLFDRPKLNQVRDEIRSGHYDTLVVYAIDRLSRNIGHLMILLEECEQYGVALRFVTENLDNTPEGKLLQSVRGYVAEVEREKIRERTMRGRRAKVLDGSINWGRPLYGYDVIDGKRVINEVTGKAVREMFQDVIAGKSLREISSEFNEKGYPTPKNGPGSVWWTSSLHHMLTNPAYVGKSHAFRYKHESRLKDGRRTKICKTTEKDLWVEVAGVTPPLISQETFDKVQEILTANKTDKRRRITREFLLRGMLRCGLCGRAMAPQTSHSRFRSYVCTSKQNKTINCGVKMASAVPAESAMWSVVENLIREPGTMQAYIESARGIGTEDRDALNGELHGIQSNIARTESELRNLVVRSESADDATWKMFEDRMKVKSKEIENLKGLEATVLRELSARQAASVDYADFERNRLKVLKRLDKMTFSDRVDLLKSLGLQVKWDGQRLKASIYTQYGCSSNSKSVGNNTVTIVVDPKNEATRMIGHPGHKLKTI